MNVDIIIGSKYVSIVFFFCFFFTVTIIVNTKQASHAVTKLDFQGPSFYLTFLVTKGHNFKTIASRVMSLALKLHLVMMSKYFKFAVDTISTF